MFKISYSLLKIFDSVEYIYGRKKLQKMIHLLEVSGMTLPFKYEYHYYGPYSADLQEEVGFLVQQGFVEETKEQDAYVYKMTDKGRHFKRMLEDESGFNMNVNEELLQILTQESSQYLEIVSTYAFLRDSGHTSEEAKKKALQLKPQLSDYLDSAIGFYNENIKVIQQ